MGPKKRKALLSAFGSLARIKQANEREMKEQAGIDLATAARLKAFLSSLDTMRGAK